MPYSARIFKVFIASPSDVKEEREAVKEAIHNWNSVHSSRENKVILPVGWENSTYPYTGRPAQKSINFQALFDCDLLIGLLKNRVGTRTDSHISGTVEEIERFKENNRPVMIYFGNQKTDFTTLQDREQAQKVSEYRDKIIKGGTTYFFEFEDISDFKSKLNMQLQSIMRDIDTLSLTTDLENGFIHNIISSLTEEALNLITQASKKEDGLIVETMRGGNNFGHMISTSPDYPSIVSINNESASKRSALLEELKRKGVIYLANSKEDGMFGYQNHYRLKYLAYQIAQVVDRGRST